ncbi:MAG: hypothetical protein RSD36_18100 [Terrisporobacter sp.]
MISKHPVHENVIKRSINDMRYEIKSLVKLLDNEPSSDVNRRFYLRCTHDVVDSLQVVWIGYNKLDKSHSVVV